MKLKENIYNSIKKMGKDELTLLYEQIKLMERLKSISVEIEENIPLHRIHEMTGSSKSNWAKSVSDDRMDRV